MMENEKNGLNGRKRFIIIVKSSEQEKEGGDKKVRLGK